MRKYLFLGIGGALGALSRFMIENIKIYNNQEGIPWNTFIINITGSFILAFILSIAYEKWRYGENLKIAITTGFLGAFTTFSTMCKETELLFTKEHYLSAILYIGLSAVLGFSFAYLGAFVSKQVVHKFYEEEYEEFDDELEA